MTWLSVKKEGAKDGLVQDHKIRAFVEPTPKIDTNVEAAEATGQPWQSKWVSYVLTVVVLANPTRLAADGVSLEL